MVVKYSKGKFVYRRISYKRWCIRRCISNTTRAKTRIWRSARRWRRRRRIERLVEKAKRANWEGKKKKTRRRTKKKKNKGVVTLHTLTMVIFFASFFVFSSASPSYFGDLWWGGNACILRRDLRPRFGFLWRPKRTKASARHTVHDNDVIEILFLFFSHTHTYTHRARKNTIIFVVVVSLFSTCLSARYECLSVHLGSDGRPLDKSVCVVVVVGLFVIWKSIGVNVLGQFFLGKRQIRLATRMLDRAGAFLFSRFFPVSQRYHELWKNESIVNRATLTRSRSINHNRFDFRWRSRHRTGPCVSSKSKCALCEMLNSFSFSFYYLDASLSSQKERER